MTTLVVVDDDPIVTRTLRITLERAGVDVRVAGSGEEALVLVREVSPPIAFIDAQMPGMDGYEVVRLLREEPPAGCRPHLIMLTASGHDTDRVRAEAAGVDEFMTKPFSPSGVVARVRELLAGS
ncbi:MAG TPA: response regulator [Acidimicrobiales bacterium]|nr:response regulator [Acidimicrobiales bacterium]